MNEGGSVAEIKLSEEDKKNPTTVALADAVNSMQALAKTQADVIKSLTSDNAGYKAAEVLDQITEGNIVLAPATKEAATKLMLSEKPEDRAQGLKDLLAGIVKGNATVELGERGHTSNHGDGTGGAIKTFNEEIAALQKANTNMSYSEAMHQVGVQKPAVQLAYLEAVRAGETA
jgi:hypothetical protein